MNNIPACSLPVFLHFVLLPSPSSPYHLFSAHTLYMTKFSPIQQMLVGLLFCAEVDVHTMSYTNTSLQKLNISEGQIEMDQG